MQGRLGGVGAGVAAVLAVTRSARACCCCLVFVCAGLMTMCWASDPLVRPNFTTVTQRLESMLANLMQDDAEAQARFVSDL